LRLDLTSAVRSTVSVRPRSDVRVGQNRVERIAAIRSPTCRWACSVVSLLVGHNGRWPKVLNQAAIRRLPAVKP